MRQSLFGLLMLAAMAGCQAFFQPLMPRPQGLEALEDLVAMKKQVLALIPIGTPRKQVEEIMFGQGIDCIGGDANTHQYRLSKPTEFLHRYEVNFVVYFDRAGKVCDVIVKGEEH
jgi:hypothetical protein